MQSSYRAIATNSAIDDIDLYVWIEDIQNLFNTRRIRAFIVKNRLLRVRTGQLALETTLRNAIAQKTNGNRLNCPKVLLFLLNFFYKFMCIASEHFHRRLINNCK